MNAGKLDGRLTIQRATTSPDAQGSVISTWNTLATVWCSAVPAAGGEATQGNERAATSDMRFSIRYQTALDDLKPKDRVFFESHTFDILTVDPTPSVRPTEIVLLGRRAA